MSAPPASSPFATAPEEIQTKFRSLVEAVYTLKDPQEIQDCQAQLHEHQRGPFAYALAGDVFQNSAEPNIRFFAALTVAIKLNNDSSLLAHDLQLLIPELVRWLTVAIEENAPAFVIRRICSTLITAYLIPQTPLVRLFPLLCASLARRRIEHDALDVTIDVEDLMKILSGKPLMYLLECGKTLAEQLRETQHNTQMDTIHRRASQNVKDVVLILKACYERNLAGERLTSTTTMCDCHLQWTKYSKSNAIDRQDHLALCALLKAAVDFLEDAVEDEREFEAICLLLEKCLKDANTSLPEEVLVAYKNMLWGSFGQLLLQQISDGEISDECLQFGSMVLAYCRRRAREIFVVSGDDVPENPNHSDRLAVMEVAQRITESSGADEFDDTLVFAVISFWEDFVQNTRELAAQDDLFAYASSALLPLCQACRLPSGDDDDDLVDVVDEIRVRVRDFVQVMCEEYGMRVSAQLLTILEKIWSQSPTASDDADKWRTFEPPLYLLTELGDSVHFATEFVDDVEANTVATQTDENSILSRIFNSPWFAALLDADRNVPKHVRRLAAKTIKEFPQYFDDRPGPLSQALELLMQQLKDNELASAAAATIDRLCSENRFMLAEERKDIELMKLVQDYFDYEAALAKAKRSLVAAAASVIEGIADQERKDSAFQWLLRVATGRLDRSVELPDSPSELLEQAAAETLDLIISIARASESPEEEPSETGIALRKLRSAYWTTGAGSQTQNRIVQTVMVALRAGDSYTKYLDKACEILQIGCREPLGGPFVFPNSTRMSFIQTIDVSHPQIESVVKLAAAVLSSEQNHFTPPKPFSEPDISDEVHVYLLRIMGHLQHPRSDPMTSSTVLDTFCRTRKLNQLLRLFNYSPTTLQFVLQFTFASLSGPESLPKRAAADFWLATLRRRSIVHGQPGNEDITRVVDAAGPGLTIALVNSFSGNANRGDLNRLADVLRELSKVGPSFKGWIEKAIMNSDFPSERVSEVDKRHFVQSIILLKGAVKVREIVLNWWIACRGTPAGYG